MSKKENKPEDDPQFDLLVDDELNEEDRRELLSGLDERPGGWRACALAFLEAQSWRKEFGAIVREPAGREASRKQPVGQGSPEQEPAVTVSPGRPGGWLRSAQNSVMIAAMAASFLAALWLGLRLKEAWRSGEPQPPSNLIVQDDTPQQPIVEHPDSPVPPGVVPPSDVPSSPWQMVSLSTPEGSHDSIRLPARQRDRLDPDWLTNLPKAMPDDVRRALERTGHHVQQHRELHPVRMEDGRQLVVPVDQVDVHYVGNPSL